MLLVQAIESLLTALRAESEDHHKADVLCEFAERLSFEILKRAGFSKPEDLDNWSNRFAFTGHDMGPDEAPADALGCLQLFDVRPTLDQQDGDVVDYLILL